MTDFTLSLLSVALWAYLAGAAGALAFQRFERLANGFGFGMAAVGGLCGLVSCGAALASGMPAASRSIELFPALIPFVRFVIRPDALGCFFGLIVSLLAVALSVYSLGYARGYFGRRNVGVLAALFNLLLLSITLVFLADHVVFFLIAWELMALSASLLVCFEHEQDESRGGAVLFFVMSHIGTAALILGFLLLFQASGSFAFADFHALGAKLSAGRRDGVFLLFLFGFGIKAGLVPLHIWLPAAHPVAPSNVSALMSGVLIKTGVYGLTRVCFDFLGAPPQWWGVTVLGLGTVSAVLGVLFALMEHDLKRLLAYHSIENIGIILMGLGAALMLLHSGHPMLASLALIAGLYHTLNHACFKALLFLGAGAVLHATHTRNMEEMGGLAKRMRWTTAFFLLGAAAISALPPLNGFVSEWLTYQSLLHGFGSTPSLIRLMFPLSGAMLALTSALAAACFVKAFGITFLAQPRGAHAREAREAPLTMLLGQGLLAATCVVLGLYPGLLLRLFDPLTHQLIGERLSQRLSLAGGLVLSSGSAQGGTVSTLGIVLMLLALLAVPVVLWALFARGIRTRIAPTWDCGLRGLTPHMQYTATGFSKPLRMIFKALFRPRREVQREYDFSPYFATTLRFESHVEEVFQTRVYRPLKWLVLRISRRSRALQAGSIQAYLIYIFLTLLALLLFAL
ncbi:MAG TPA: hydrogenase 4 subunit B [Candidatus Paceibacterota bacterium]|nr:hydrogenase 4 subunit B [Candidatus Paceibacterota bacterium]